MQVAHVVAEVGGDSKKVGDLWRARAFGCGFEAEVAGFGVDAPVLDMCISISCMVFRELRNLRRKGWGTNWIVVGAFIL